MCDGGFNRRREELGVRQGAADSTVPRDPTGRAYCTEVGCGAGQGACWDGLRTEAGEGGHLGGAPKPYSTVHTPSTVGR